MTPAEKVIARVRREFASEKTPATWELIARVLAGMVAEFRPGSFSDEVPARSSRHDVDAPNGQTQDN